MVSIHHQARTVEKKTDDIRCRCHPPILVTSFRQALDNVRFIAHQSEEPHYFFSTGPNPA